MKRCEQNSRILHDFVTGSLPCPLKISGLGWVGTHHRDRGMHTERTKHARTRSFDMGLTSAEC